MEIKQFVGEGMKTLVPRVMGQTAEAQGRKEASSRTKLTEVSEDEFLSDLAAAVTPPELEVAKKLLQWMKQNSCRLDYWRGIKKDGTSGAVTKHRNGMPFSIKRDGKVNIPFGGWMRVTPPFDSEKMRQRMLKRLNDIDGVSLPADSVNHHRSISLAALIPEPSLQQFIDANERYIEEVKKAESPSTAS